MNDVPLYWWWTISAALTAAGVVFAAMRWWQTKKFKEEIKDVKKEAHDDRQRSDDRQS